VDPAAQMAQHREIQLRAAPAQVVEPPYAHVGTRGREETREPRPEKAGDACNEELHDGLCAVFAAAARAR